MSIRAFIQRRIERAAERESAAVDAQVSDILWRANLEELPRIVRADRVNRGQAIELPGVMFPDGKARLVVNRLQRLDEPAAIKLLDEAGSGI